MKAVLISIRPRWCELIASGKKTIEVRKTRPKLDEPFKCYIYCTKPDIRRNTHAGCLILNDDELYRHPKKGICYGDSIELTGEDNYTKDNFLNGKVIGDFVCDRIDHFLKIGIAPNFHLRAPGFGEIDYGAIRLTEQEMLDYGGLYGWHISELKIYDKPKGLREFGKTRPPQSWCYVWLEQEGNESA